MPKIFICFEVVKLLSINKEALWLVIAYTHIQVQFQLFYIVTCYKISNLIDTHYAVWCHAVLFSYISNYVEYLDKKESYENSTKEFTVKKINVNLQ